MGERGIAVSVALGLAGGVAVPEPASKGQVLSQTPTVLPQAQRGTVHALLYGDCCDVG